jgi:hypothetical protein
MRSIRSERQVSSKRTRRNNSYWEKLSLRHRETCDWEVVNVLPNYRLVCGSWPGCRWVQIFVPVLHKWALLLHMRRSTVTDRGLEKSVYRDYTQGRSSAIPAKVPWNNLIIVCSRYEKSIAISGSHIRHCCSSTKVRRLAAANFIVDFFSPSRFG